MHECKPWFVSVGVGDCHEKGRPRLVLYVSRLKDAELYMFSKYKGYHVDVKVTAKIEQF